MKTLVVAKVLLVNERGQLLLLQRSETDTRRPLEWDVPGGQSEGEEFGEEAASRETLEEAGIALKPRQLKLIYAMTQSVAPDVSVSWLFYIGRTTESNIVLSHEHIAYKWSTLAEALELLDYERQKQVLTYVQEHGLLETV